MKRFLLLSLLLPLAGAGCGSTNPQAIQPTIAPVSELCTVSPTEDESGARIFPIAEKYSRLPHLGQIFTALDCGDRSRAQQVRGITGETYTLGVTLSWETEPVSDLKTFLERNGFSETATGTWETANPLVWDQIIGLYGFFKGTAAGEGFRYEDCILCG
jgi:hypothetical protein